MIPDAVASVGSPADAAATAEIPRARSEQDQELANDLGEAKGLIQSALDSPELIAALTPSGYDVDELKAGLALWEKAQAAFDARASAAATSAQTKDARDKAFDEVYAEFTSYRATVQVDYKGAERAALGASGKIPGDLERFQTAVRAAYAAAQKDPYTIKLTKSGFPATRLKAGIVQLDAFVKIDAAFKQADRATADATATRDEAADKLAKWIAKFRKLAKVASKKAPSLRAILGV